MPRRTQPDPFALAVGLRIQALRKEGGLTMEQLAEASALGSKGHLSSIEKGLVRPTVQTLKVLSEKLGVLPLDLLTFPLDDPRQALIDATRGLSASELNEVLAQLAQRRGAPTETNSGERGAKKRPAA